MKKFVAIALSAFYLSSCSMFADKTNAADTANALIVTMNSDQKKLAVMDYNSKDRHNWHFFPLETRKGFMIKDMSVAQRELTVNLLGQVLSKVGLERALAVMDLEKVLKALENNSPKRDSEKYYLTLFGTPNQGLWGISYEGHHLSLNFVIDGDELVSATPLFYGINPAKVIKNGGTGAIVGSRLLNKQEDLALKFFNSLTAEQKKVALVSTGEPPEMVGYNANPGPMKKEGISVKKFTAEQKNEFTAILHTFTENAEKGFAEESNYEFNAELDDMYFAWYGTGELDKAHSFRIEGPATFIEFHNYQEDSLKTKANHIHSLWRNRTKDFGYNLKKPE
jgi:hypothetical protein